MTEDFTQQVRVDLLWIIKFGCLGIALMVVGLCALCWQHQVAALVGLAVGLVLMFGNVIFCAYKLGQRS